MEYFIVLEISCKNTVSRMQIIVMNTTFLHLRLNVKLNVEIFELNFILQKQLKHGRNWTRNLCPPVAVPWEIQCTNNTSESVAIIMRQRTYFYLHTPYLMIALDLLRFRCNF